MTLAAKQAKLILAGLWASHAAVAAALGNDCAAESGACPAPPGRAEGVVDEFSTLQFQRDTLGHRKPRALAVFDIDFTLFGVASSLIGTDCPLYSETFYDTAFIDDTSKNKTGYGEIWGLARGLVPDVSSFVDRRILGPQSILSTSHPLFGANSPLDVTFGIVSDGPSLNEYAFSQDGHPVNLTEQVAAVRFLRAAVDYNPRWHILDTGVYSCSGKFDKTTKKTFAGYKLNPVQQGCTDFGHKDIMVQNILDYYANAGWPKFDYILFADDQKGNLQTVKEASHLGGKYTFGAPFRPREDISTNSFFVAYPSGGTSYEVRPRGDGSFPNNCGGCYYVTTAGEHVPPLADGAAPGGNPATEVQPFQGMIAGIGSRHYYSTIAADGGLSGRHPL